MTKPGKCEVRLYSALTTQPQLIAQQINKYLEENEGMDIANYKLTCSNGMVVVMVLYSPLALAFIPNYGNNSPFPGTIPAEITCDQQDPWHGEFIPHGGVSPIQSAISVFRTADEDFVPKRRNAAEQFGAGVH